MSNDAKQTVWLVTTGEYSSYQVVGVFSSREKAEYAKRLWASRNELEEYALDWTPPRAASIAAGQLPVSEDRINRTNRIMSDKLMERVERLVTALERRQPEGARPYEVTLEAWRKMPFCLYTGQMTELTGLGEDALAEEVKEGRLHPFIVGGRRRWRKAEALQYFLPKDQVGKVLGVEL